MPHDRVVWKDGTVYNGNSHEALTRFKSSDNAYREFCSTCGASIFYATMKRPGLLDIALGVVRAEDGVLAKSFVELNTERIDHIDDALDQELVQLVARNLKVLGK